MPFLTVRDLKDVDARLHRKQKAIERLLKVQRSLQKEIITQRRFMIDYSRTGVSPHPDTIIRYLDRQSAKLGLRTHS